MLPLAAAALLWPQMPPTISVERMRADIGFLTSTPLKGRVALEDGAAITAEFIAAEFAKAGLRPLPSGGYLQEFELTSSTLDANASWLKLTRDGRTESLAASGGFSRDVDLTAPAVFAGYGISAPEYGYDDYAAIDAAGRVVIIFEREPRETDARSPFLGTGLTRHAATRAKLLNAQRHGAVAVITIPSSRSALRTVRSSPTRGNARVLYDDGARIPVLRVEPETADTLLAPLGRASQLQTQMDESLRPASALLPGTVSIRRRHSARQSGTTWNVIGWIEGADPALKHEFILLDAHYDHLPSADRPYPGANDNASGTASLLELARVCARGERPRRSLVFVAFGAEENGLLGAYHYVSHPPFPLEKTRAVLNLDMIARDEAHTPQTEGLLTIPSDTANLLNLVGAPYSPGLAAAVGEANRRIGLALDDKYDHDSSQNVLWRCDHFPFLLAGVPALWLFGGFHPGYHEREDTMEKLNYVKLERVTLLAYYSAWELAQTDHPPLFEAGPRPR